MRILPFPMVGNLATSLIIGHNSKTLYSSNKQVYRIKITSPRLKTKSGRVDKRSASTAKKQRQSFCTERKPPCHSASSEKTPRHSARSEAELQNLMSKQTNQITRDLEDSATARRMTSGFRQSCRV